ncbi:ATP-binding protein [Proteiniclasticum sp. C24MP]|uniref:ATP-binding protein n=1 Tax=Proteiniclasticum sp. C24MP TaxID=3374101 RepID=UPI0037547EB9
MFVGRKEELDLLEDQYKSSDFHFTVIYGRRRIGKTELIRQYIRDKNAVYYMATETSGEKNLEMLSKLVLEYSGTEFRFNGFSDFEALFDYLTEISKKERLVFVLDEFPYLAAAYPGISSLIQKYCDHNWRNTRLHLILCGSSMSFMENQVLGMKSPLYGRRTMQIRLKAFSFFETETFLAPMKKEDIALLHCATGGVAEYLSYVDKRKTLDENLTALFFTTSGRMYEEPVSFLKQELREPGAYNAILEVIAGGARKNNEIATKVQKSTGAINNYLDNLIELGILLKEKPIGEMTSRKTIYRISDGSFRFWYRYVFQNRSAIEIGLGDRLYQEQVKKDLPNFMGEGFEEIFLDYFDRMNRKGSLPVLITARGRWWGNNPKLKREEEIDVVGFGRAAAVLCEVKWTNRKIGMEVIDHLMEKSALFDAAEKYFILFSKNGFTKKAMETAVKSGRIQLISFMED